MFDHIGIRVDNVEKAIKFYEIALEPLGFANKFQLGVQTAFGTSSRPHFFIYSGETNSAIHLSFSASSKEAVDEFYAAAINAGATANGEPGLRTQYHSGYYGGFVIDPFGNNIEATFHG